MVLCETLQKDQASAKMRIPWRLTSNFHELDSLFKDHSLPYCVDAYLCNCEDVDTQTVMYHKGLESETEFECPSCGNKDFYNANQFIGNSPWHNPIDTLFSTEILDSLVPDIIVEDSAQLVKLRIKIDIPYCYDSSRNRLLYQEKILYEAVLSPSKSLTEHIYVDFGLNGLYDPMEYIFSYELPPQMNTLIKQNQRLINYRESFLLHIKCDERFAHIAALHKCMTLYQAAILIAYPHLKNFEFIYWKDHHLLPNNRSMSTKDALDFIMDNRTEKSFKKAVYQHYEQLIMKENAYNFSFVYLIARHIKDVNFARKILSIDMNRHLEGISFDSFERFFVFLINSYTPKQLIKLFREYIKRERYWFADTMRFFENAEDDFSEIPKTRCSVSGIHNILVDHIEKMQQMRRLAETIFTYEEPFRKPCGVFGEYVVQLPQTGRQLYEWGRELRNCLTTYCNLITIRKTTVYGVFIDQNLHIAIEIQEGKIVQSSTRFNGKLSIKEADFIKNWYGTFFQSRQIDFVEGLDD